MIHLEKCKFDSYIRMHRLMWLNMCQEIAKVKHPIDTYTFKHHWTHNKYRRYILNYCSLCECARILKNEVADVSYFKGSLCRYCPCIWPSNGDDDHECMCDYNFHFDCLAGWDTTRYGLHMSAEYIYENYDDLYAHDGNLSVKDRRMIDKLWKKQCKICFKIAMLPVRDDLDNLITESLNM